MRPVGKVRTRVHSVPVHRTVLASGFLAAACFLAGLSLSMGQGSVVWWNPAWDQRIPIAVTTGNYGSEDQPLEYPIDLASRLAAAGDPNPFDSTSVRLIEYNMDGTVQREVPSQYEVTQRQGIAVIQFADTYTVPSTTLTPALTGLGVSHTDVTASLLADTLDYDQYSVLLIDSFATADLAIRTALNADAPRIQAFVAQGGVVVVLSQANQDLSGSPTLAGAVAWAPRAIKYGDPDGTIQVVDPGHALWTTPNAVDPNAIGGTPCWECLTEWDAAYTIRAYVTGSTTEAAAAELAWGRGRFLFTAIPADVRAVVGSPAEQAASLDLLENIVTWAQASFNPEGPRLVWVLDGTTAPNSTRHFYVYFDSWDGVDPGTRKGDPAYATDLTVTGTIVENSHFRFDVGGFTVWTVKDIGGNAPAVWGPPAGVYVMSSYAIYNGFDVKPVAARVLSQGPVRAVVRLEPTQGPVMDMAFYAGVPAYRRSVLAVPTAASSLSIDTEAPCGNISPWVVGSGIPANGTGDLAGFTDVQGMATAVAGTDLGWLAVYDPGQLGGYAEIAAIADIARWGAERSLNPGTMEEYIASRLPVRAWSYYFEYTTTVAAVMDPATQRFGNPPTLAETQLEPVLVYAGPDVSADEGEAISFSGVVAPDVLDPTYSWTFGDGQNASGSLTPVHTYPDEGTFQVTLSVDSSSHGVLTDDLVCSISNVAPQVSAGPDQSVMLGDPMSFAGAFTDPGVNDIHTIEWDFGDGQTATGTLTPTHTYLVTDTYTVTLTVTDDDGGIGTDTLVADVQVPSATAGTGDPLVGAGALVEASASDITMRNDMLALTIAVVYQDAQLTPEGPGHVIDAAATGRLDGLDWVKIGLIEPTRSEGGNAWDIRTVSYDTVSVTNPGPAHAAVLADGTYTVDTGIKVATSYDLDPEDRFVTVTTLLTNQTAAAASFWFADVLDYDAAGQQAYIPSIGAITGTSTATAQPFERWMAMWGTGPESYAILYEDPVTIYGTSAWIKASYPFNLAAGASATFVRYLIVTDATGYASQLAAIQDVVDDFPPPIAADATVLVTDSASSAPLEGATVTLTAAAGGTTSGVTNASGLVTLHVNPGDFTLRAQRSGYYPSTPQSVTIPEGASNWSVLLDPRPVTGVDHFILVVSDGMSWEVLNRVAPPNIMSMIATGGASVHGVSEVPAVTSTNTQTIYSGAHCDTTGVVGNAYLNRQSESYDTIQAAVQRSGGTFSQLSSAAEIVSRIQAGTLATYTLWWWGGTDSAGHHYGTESTQYESAIRSMDTSIGQIMSALQASPLLDTTVLGLGADHGMNNLLPAGDTAPLPSHVLDMRDILENQNGIPVFSWRGSGPRMAHVYLTNPAQAAAAKAVMQGVTGVDRVYTKAELDDTDLGGDVFAHASHPNTGDIAVFAAPEYSVGRSVVQSAADGLPANNGQYYWDCSNDYRGGHGGLTGREQYIPFLLWGNAITPGCSMGPHPNVDWAPTIAALLEITAPNDSEGVAALECLPPVATGDSYTADEGATLTVAAPGVLANDRAPAGRPLTAILVADATRGSLTLHPDGSFEYTATPALNGPDSFTYKAFDGQLNSNVVSVQLAINEDEDEDGYGPPTDCDDFNPDVHPGAPELCNGIDDNCVLGIDENPEAGANSCADSDACTQDLCLDAACSHPGVDCSDSNPCTLDSCDAGTGCGHAADPVGTCDDGLVCNGSELCQDGVCQAGLAIDCSDGVACTIDSCTEPSGTCQHAPDDALCADISVCTDDSCNPVSGCVHSPNAASCSDDDACTTGDACSGGECVSGGPTDCDDGLACTADSCDTADGCVHASSCLPGEICNPGTGLCQLSPAPELPILPGAQWKYFKGRSEPPASWKTLVFDDSSWPSGPSGLGYGDNDDATLLSDMGGTGGYLSVYARRTFDIPDLAAWSGLTLTIDYDDAYVAYLNGVEVARSASMGGTVGVPPSFDTAAPGFHEAAGGSPAGPPDVIPLSLSAVVQGRNILAIQGHNQTLSSSDFSLIPRLEGTANPAPDQPTNPYPASGATEVATTLELCVDVHDDNGDVLTVTFFGREAGDPAGFQTVGVDTRGGGGGRACASWSALRSGRAHEWYVTIDDGNSTITGPTYAFSTGCTTPAECADSDLCTDDACDPSTHLCVYTFNTAPCNDGNPCTVGEACSAGVCTGGSAPPEVCNGLDDDCNPATADGSAETGYGDPCDGTDADLCLEGTRACQGGPGLVCDDPNDDDPEVCDGLDNDCDASVDDGLLACAWWSPSWHHRLPLTVHADGMDRSDAPIELTVDFAAELAAQGATDPFDPSSPRVIEQDCTTGALVEKPSQLALVPAAQLKTIAVVQFVDTYTSTSLASLLQALAVQYTDVTASLTAGTLNYGSFDVLLIDSFATQSASIRSALDADAAEIQAFVAGGGVVLMLSQANQDLNGGVTAPPPPGGPPGAVAWAPFTIKYSDADFNVAKVDPTDPLWAMPSLVAANGWAYQTGNECWESLTEWDPAYQILAYGTGTTTNAAIAELAHGSGRFAFLAMAPDVEFQLNGTGAADAKRLMGNFLQRYGVYPASRTYELVWILDGPTPAGSQRVFHLYFDAVSEAGVKGDPAYVTDLSASAGAILRNENLELDFGAFSLWNVRTSEAGAWTSWKSTGPMNYYRMREFVFQSSLPTAIVLTLEQGPIRKTLRVTPTGTTESLDVTMYSKAPYYRRVLRSLSLNPLGVPVAGERPGGNFFPKAMASGPTRPVSFPANQAGTDAKFSAGAPAPHATCTLDCIQPVAGTNGEWGWLAMYDDRVGGGNVGVGSIARMAAVENWGVEVTDNDSFLGDEYPASSLPATTYLVYFELESGSPAAPMDRATLGIVSPPRVVWGEPGDSDGDGDPDCSDCLPAEPNSHHGAPEICDGLDNDCDTLVDNGNPGGGAACTTGVPGVCADGTETCQAGAFVCVQNVQPTSEVCDGLDNDCDGFVDEDLIATLSLPEGLEGIPTSVQSVPVTLGVVTELGVYAADVQVQFDAAVLSVQGVAEGSALAGKGCTLSPNLGIPGHVSFGVYCTSPLDGGGSIADISFQVVGTYCQSSALSFSRARLNEECPVALTDGGSLLVQGPELCDGLDNDCDTLIDNGDPGGGQQCGTDVGACEFGATACVAGQVACMGGVEPVAESCDGLDNDCDGAADDDLLGSLTVPDGLEGAPGQTIVVPVALGDVSGVGVYSADVHVQFDPAALLPLSVAPGTALTGKGCSLTPNLSIPDRVTVGIYCTLALDGNGSLVEISFQVVGGSYCAPTALAFSRALLNEGCPAAQTDGGSFVLRGPETCDGFDNDCNGSTDEALGTTTCGLGVCTHTVDNCVGGVPQSCDPFQGASAEVCDGLDNDCSGATDDGVAALCDDGDNCTADVCNGFAGCGHAVNGYCSVSGSVSYYRTSASASEPSTKPVPEVGIDADADGDAEATTGPTGTFTLGDLLGNVSVSPLARFYATPWPAEQDDSISSLDASRIAQYNVGLYLLTANQFLAGDVTGNGEVSSFDASYVAQFAAHLVQHLPVAVSSGSDWKFLACDPLSYPGSCAAPVYNFTPITGPVQANFYGILYGDVTGNYPGTAGSFSPDQATENEALERDAAIRDRQLARDLAAAPAAATGSFEATGPVEMYLSGAAAPLRVGSSREIQVSLSNAHGILGMDLEIDYDPTRVAIRGVKAAGIGSGFSVVGNARNGRYSIAAYGIRPLAGSGAFLTLTVEALADSGAGLTLRLGGSANEGQVPLRVRGRGPAPIVRPEREAVRPRNGN